MPALWHWKHLLNSTSFPGASGEPTGGLRCANARPQNESAINRARICQRRKDISDLLPRQCSSGRLSPRAVGKLRGIAAPTCDAERLRPEAYALQGLN